MGRILLVATLLVLMGLSCSCRGNTKRHVAACFTFQGPETDFWADVVICVNPIAQTQAVGTMRRRGKVVLFGGLPGASPSPYRHDKAHEPSAIVSLCRPRYAPMIGNIKQDASASSLDGMPINK